MLRTRLFGIALIGALALAPAVAHADSWGRIVTMGSITSNTLGRLCSGIPDGFGKYFDIHCPSYAPSITTAGDVSVTGNLSAAQFIGDGSGLTGITANQIGGLATDRIISGTTSILASQNSSLTFTTSNTQRMVIGDGGNIGIGTAYPGRPLHIVGAGELMRLQATTGTNNASALLFAAKSAYQSYTQNSVGSWMAGLDGYDDAKFKFGSAGGFTDPVLTLTRAGNVGISTSTPSATLHVVGTGRFTSWTAIAANVTPTAELDVYGTVSATRFRGDGSQLTGITPDATDRITSGTTRMVVVSNTGYVSLTQAGTNTGWFSPYTGLVTLGVSATGPISGSSGYFNGNVGIGISNPVDPMHVNGNVRIEAGQPALAFLENDVAANSRRWRLAASDETLMVQALTDGGAGGGNNFKFNRSNEQITSYMGYAAGLPWFTASNALQKVGIGTITPTATLQVSGSLLVSTTGQTSNPTLYATTGGNVGIGTGDPQASLQVSGSFIVSTSAQTSTPSLYVGTDGKVGIGTDSPIWALTVRAQPGEYPATVLTNSDWATSSAGSALALTTGATSGNTYGHIQAYTAGASAGGDLVLNGWQGNVGIHTTTPSRTLHVVGPDGAVASLPTDLGPKDVLVIENNANANLGFVAGAGAVSALKFYENGGSVHKGGLQFDHASNLMNLSANADLTMGLTMTTIGSVSVTDALQVGSSSLTCTPSIGGAIRYSTPSIQVCNGGSWVAISGSGGGSAVSSTGAIQFNAGGSFGGDTNNLYWDNANKRLGVGTLAPSSSLHVYGNVPTLRLMDDNDAASYFEIQDTADTQTVLKKVTASGSNMIDLIPAPSDGTSAAKVRLFRTTNTSGAKALEIFRGDGGTTIDHFLGAGSNVNSYLAANGGRVGIGTNTPALGTLEVVSSSDKAMTTPLVLANPNNTSDTSVRMVMAATDSAGANQNGLVHLVAKRRNSGAMDLSVLASPGGSGAPAQRMVIDGQVGSVSFTNAVQIGASSLTCASSISGSIRYNTTSDTLQVCTSGGWKSLVSNTAGLGASAAASSTGAVQFNAGGGFGGDTNNLYWDNANKRLGVGINTPARDLHVYTPGGGGDGIGQFGSAFGAIISGDSGGRGVFGTNLYVDGAQALRTGGTHATYGYAGIAAQWGNLSFYTSDGATTADAVVTPTTRMYISTGGNVGIGTATPDRK
ncbi:MAG: beta strand repeat-containing protein, partial [Hyphomicrobiaceae bacterium]